MSQVAHWDCWGWRGELEHVNKPVPNSTPEAAMDELLAKARFVLGDQPWQEWHWEARELPPRVREARDVPPWVRRVIVFRWDGAWRRLFVRGEHYF